MQTKTKNNLWVARSRAGLGLNQVAHLSEHSPDVISRYERGLNIPGLEIALKLEIIYKVPVQKLFKELYRQASREIREIEETNKQSLLSHSIYKNGSKTVTAKEFCPYNEFLKSNLPNEIELETVTRHIIDLNNMVMEYKSPRN